MVKSVRKMCIRDRHGSGLFAGSPEVICADLCYDESLCSWHRVSLEMAGKTSGLESQKGNLYSRKVSDF